jgi:hypothetical protein
MFQEGVMLCPECKHHNPEDNRFCGMCGARLQWTNAETYTPDIAPEPVEPLVRLPSQFAGPSSSQPDQESLEQQIDVSYDEYTDALLADLLPGETDVRGHEPALAHAAPHVWEEKIEASIATHPEAPPVQPVQPPLHVQVQEHSQVQEQEAREEHEELDRQSAFAIGGPSFLGLGQFPATGEPHSYLFEDEPEASGRGWIIAAVFVLIIGAVAIGLARNWHGSRDWAITRGMILTQQVRNWSSGSAPPSASSQPNASPAANMPAAPPAANGSAVANPSANSAGTPANPTTTPAEGAQQPAAAQNAGSEPNPTNSAQAPADARPAMTVENPNSANQKGAGGQNTEYEAANTAPKNDPPTTTAETAGATAQQALPPRKAALPSKAELTKASAQQKPGDDLVAQGERFLYGEGVRRDCNQALVYFRAGAEEANPRALSRMGALYATGTCVPMDRVMAYNWFSRALAHDSKNQLLEENLNMLWRDMSSGERNQVLEPKAR